MSELDEAWELAIAEAERRARRAGRSDVAEYLALRASNDLARRAGIDWLMTTFTAAVGEANRAGASVSIKHDDLHRFRSGTSTMVGTLITFRCGVRSLMIEAGWPHIPRDGIVRGGGLASAHVRHFGRRSADEELLLLRSREGAPQWVALQKEGARTFFTEERVRHHVKKFLQEG